MLSRPIARFHRCSITAWLLSAALVALVAVPVRAVAPVTPVDAAGTQDQVFRVIRQDSVTNGITNGDGTGTVFDWAIQNVDGTNYLRMCMVTADHVLRGTTLGGLGFRNENPQGTFPGNSFDFQPMQSVIKLGSAGVAAPNSNSGAGWAGGGKDTPDIAFIGVTINLSNVGGTPASGNSFNDATKAVLLQAAAAEAIPLGVNTNLNQVTFHGYGDSGQAPTAQDVLNGWGTYKYIHHDNTPNAEQYGILRPLSDSVSVLEYARAQNGTLSPGGTYKYQESFQWQLSNTSAGYGLSGDSGAALIDASKIVGVFNLSEGARLKVNNAGATVAEGVKNGYLENGVTLTQDYVNWLEQDCRDFMALGVPEPSTLLLVVLALPFAAVYVQRVRRRRAA